MGWTDAIPCAAKTRGRHLDLGESIRFLRILCRSRPISRITYGMPFEKMGVRRICRDTALEHKQKQEEAGTVVEVYVTLRRPG